MGTTDQIVLWISIFMGVVSLVIALYRLFEMWVVRRGEKRDALLRHAGTAVRLTDAGFVRPLLRQRMHECVTKHLEHGPLDRLRLFDELQQEVGLRRAEKDEARTQCFNTLVELLQDTLPPVVHLHTDDQLRRATPRLISAIEQAYSAYPRPTATMIAALGNFLASSPPPA